MEQRQVIQRITELGKQILPQDAILYRWAVDGRGGECSHLHKKRLE